MSPRVRWVIAVAAAAVVFALIVWFDAVVVKNDTPGGVWLYAVGSIAVAGAAILYAGLAWWSRSLTAGLIFIVGGAAELLVAPILYMFPGDWPYYLNLTLSWWTGLTAGPINAAPILGGALVVAGVIGLYSWATTRRLAVVDR
jgi:hypothetical protein